jgi:thiamine-monophosphate kinase
MGAEPLAINLSLSLPDSDTQWINDFSEGFFSLAAIHNMQLIGGDTTRGPLSISVTIFGIVPKGQAIRRSTAKVGDSIYVTGTLGDAGAALLGLMGELKLTGRQQQVFNERLNRPQPRVAMGTTLRGVASSCIDISDGLTADLGHILQQSNLGAMLYADQLPVSSSYQEIFDLAGGWHLPLNAGDDYELCFTVSESNLQRLETVISSFEVPITCIGAVGSNAGLHLLMPDGLIQTIEPRGYDHFKS